MGKGSISFLSQFHIKHLSLTPLDVQVRIISKLDEQNLEEPSNLEII